MWVWRCGAARECGQGAGGFVCAGVADSDVLRASVGCALRRERLQRAAFHFPRNPDDNRDALCEQDGARSVFNHLFHSHRTVRVYLAGERLLHALGAAIHDSAGADGDGVGRGVYGVGDFSYGLSCI